MRRKSLLVQPLAQQTNLIPPRGPPGQLQLVHVPAHDQLQAKLRLVGFTRGKLLTTGGRPSKSAGDATHARAIWLTVSAWWQHATFNQMATGWRS